MINILKIFRLWWHVSVCGVRPTPEQMVAHLRGIGFSNDQIVDIVKRVADETGQWTPKLERVGLLALKPGAPKGQEKEA